ncbi:MAG: PAS domain S-box protein [Nitrospirae bacterium]|nr:PAS domain S-box protein [Nitrospirota bacterium]
MNKNNSFHKILTTIKEFDEEIAHLHFSYITRRSLEFIQNRLGIRRASIALLQKETGGFLLYEAGMEIKGIESGKFLPFEKTVLSEVINHAEPLYRPNIKTWQTEYEVDKILLKAGFRSDLLIPLVVNKQCIGTLNVCAMKIKGIIKGKRFVLQFLAPRLAQAIQNALYVDALEENKQKYRALIESIEEKHFIYIHNTEGVFTYISPSIIKILGYTSEEFLTHYTRYLTDNPVNKEVERHTELSIKGEQQQPYEVEIYHKDGSIRWLEVSEVPVYSSNGHVLAVQGIAYDITERKQAEKDKIAGEERYRKLVDSVTDYIFTVEVRNGKAVSTKHGPGCIAVTGYSSEEYEADPYLWYRMVHEEDRESVIKHANRAISGESIQPLEHRIIHKNGDVKWVRNTPVPRYDKDGKLIAYDGLIVDITERKKAEEEKLRLQEQLLQSQKMEAVGLLAGGVAHDFNNILTAIIGYANIIKMKMKKEDPLKAHLDHILRSSERGAHLTQSLLAFSRKQLISPKPVDINIIIRNVQKLLGRVIAEDIELKVVLDERHLTIMADSGQMEQILMNLATNAKDAMPQGGSLTIGTEISTIDEQFIKQHGFGDRGEYALLSVADTGIGMDEKTRERIFEPFFTTKEVGRGTGLGLAMVYGAIKQNGGYITVLTEPGKGTTFNIYLPLINTMATKEITSQIVEIIKGGTETILIAEDDESLRELAGSVLKEFGYTVIEAKDGADAIEKFNEHKEKVKFLILDVIMPKKNGKEVYDEIKKIYPGIKALFVSGYTSEIVHKKGIIDLKLNFLPKPILPNQLLKKVREILDEEVKKI